MAKVPFPLIAVDIGNARTKLGRFDGPAGDGLPEPVSTFTFDDRQPQWDRLGEWLESIPPRDVPWWIGSVNRPATTQLLDWLRTHRQDDPLTLLAADDLPITAAVERPDMVGIDRLLSAVAANRLRRRDRPAVVADLGSAITVDLVSADGVFQGGAILPGIAMSARAMYEFTDLLPLIEMSELAEPPPALGTSTVAAMRSGLFWLAVGAIRELIGQFCREFAAEPEVFMTGGAGPSVAALIGRHARYVPHLTLAGIALAAEP
ncbi:MAG TPA: type III pantothenate kinase [Thermoguttaceae bacterium]|nr:type III pantothenate kinase [Thermoguttaceae bacterium]